MNSPMESLPDVPSLSAGTLTSDSIRQWRDSVEEFFNVEGRKVRGIILELEESLWEGELPADKSARSEAEPPIVELTMDANVRPAAPVSGDPKQLRRLEDLAKRIGDRLSRQSVASSAGSNG